MIDDMRKNFKSGGNLLRLALEMLPRLAACAFAAMGAASPARAGDITLLTEYWVPYVRPAKPTGTDGLAVALVQKILHGAGLRIKPVVQPWPRTYKMALNGRNVLVFSMVRVPERDKLFSWIAPLFVSQPGVLIYARDAPLPRPTSIQELKTYKVCCTPGTPFYLKLRELGFEPNENLLELQTMFPGRVSPAGNELTLVPRHCQFMIAGWPPLMALFRRRGARNPEAKFASYDAPDTIFGTNMKAWLVASRNFDPAILQAITASYQAAFRSGELHAICRARFNFDEETCRLLTPD
ncbi:MAG: substrate-binding periplasmic protein [Hyphomicrobiaceae bacterium]